MEKCGKLIAEPKELIRFRKGEEWKYRFSYGIPLRQDRRIFISVKVEIG